MAAIELGSTSLFNDANLKSYYKLEDTADSSGNSKTLTNNNTVAFNAAKFNNGADQGTSNTNKSLSIADNLGIAGNSDASFVFWVKLQTEIGSGFYWFFTHASTTTADRYVGLYYDYNGGTRRLAGAFSGGTDPTYTITLGTSNWYHMAIVRSGSNGLVYVNGVQQATAALGTGTASLNQLVIGANTAKAVPSSAIIDDFGAFNRALTATEVGLLYNGSAGFFTFF